MDFAYMLCVLVSSLFLPGGFGQEPGAGVSFQIKISPDAQDQLFDLGRPRVISCQSSTPEGSEKPVLHWTFNEVKIPDISSSDRVGVESVNATTLWLRFKNVSSSDGGIYKCVGTLGSQSDSRIVRIEVYETINIKSLSEQYGVLGQTGVITCEASGRPPPSYTWKYLNGSKIIDNDRLVVLPNRITITNLTFADNGTYLCDITVIQTGESKPHEIKFEVVKLPVIEEEPVVKPSVPKVGDKVTISCEADGVPEPTYQFKRDGSLFPENQVDSTLGILTISELDQSHEGSIVCVASNKGGSDEKSVFLDVKIPPTIRAMPSETEAKEGEEKQITCVADGDPAPTVTWSKDEEEDDEDSDDAPQETEQTEGDEAGTGNKTVLKTIHFGTIRPSHGGSYTCTAASGVGMTSITVRLNVKYEPNFNTNYKEDKFYGWGGHTTNMTCLVSANEVATIKWYKSSQSDSGISEEPIIGDEVYILSPTQNWPDHHLSSSSLLVANPDDDRQVFGEYICEAQNSLGTKRKTVTLVKAVGPGSPIIRITKVLPTMATVEIDVPENDGGQPVNGYFYSYFPLNDTSEGDQKYMDQYVEAESGTTTYVDLKKLLTKTAYVLQVRARNVVGEGDQATSSFETTDVSKPQQLNMTSAREGTEATSYKITWSEPYNGGSVITQYIIKFKKVTVADKDAPQWQVESDLDKTFMERTIEDPNARSYTLENLDRNSFYDIRITAKNKEGESIEEAKIIKTGEGGGKQASQAASAGLGFGTIIGIIVGLLVLIFLVASVLYLVFKKKPELVGRLRGLGGKGGEEERGKSDDGKDPAEEEKLIKKEDAVKVENETDEGKPEQAVEEPQEEFEPDSKPEVQPTPDAGAPNGVADKSPELSTPAATTEIKITPETPEKPENPPA